MAINLAPFGRWTLRDKAAQRRLALRSSDDNARPLEKPRMIRGFGSMYTVEEMC